MERDSGYWVIVPAAGSGSRMGAAIPKQYLPLGGRMVIDHTLDRLLASPKAHKIIVALAAGDRQWGSSEFCGHGRVVTVTGGASRMHSVCNALQALANEVKAEDWVMVHDAARPLVRQEDLERLSDAARMHPSGALLGVPVTDTMKWCDSTGEVRKTMDRNTLWRAFTPQMFRYGPLRKTLEGAVDAGVLFTDEAGAMEHAGATPQLVEGHSDNIKVTHQEDLELAEFYLRRQRHSHENRSRV